MADTNGVPRRVSMAYILGFSNKPYKEVRPPAPPPPPQARRPSQPVSMIPTPGRIVEWTASDGRKGKLTGATKPRLTAASLAKVPSDKRSTKEALGAKSVSKKAASNKPAADESGLWGANDWGATDTKSESNKSNLKKEDAWKPSNSGNGKKDSALDGWRNPVDASSGDDKKGEKDDMKKDDTTAALATTTNAPAAPSEEVEKKDGESNAWTKEQDEKLMQMKTEDVKMPWSKISDEVGKAEGDCKERFNVIKPKDWKPNGANQGGGGGGKKRKNKQADNQNQGKGGNNKNEKKDGNKEDEKQDEISGGTAGADTSAWDKNGERDFGNTTGGGDGTNDAAIRWGPNSGANCNTDSNKDQDKDKGSAGVADPWTGPAPAQNSSSNQAASHPGSQHKASNNNVQPIATRPLEFEVKPDDTFSADDLRLIARILQQDCSMVWNRVSWRFRDKTGRTLHPDDFEKKITGRLEGKESDKGERRR